MSLDARRACAVDLRQVPGELLGKTLLDRFVVEEFKDYCREGVIYIARDLQLARDVVVKSLEKRDEFHERSVARFRTEALAAARLQHPSVVAVYATGETGGIFWIAMEYLEGEVLEDRLERRGRLDSKDLMEILSPICEAIAEAHDAGVLHRDLKPGNVMVVSRGGRPTPVVFDFGIACLVYDERVTQMNDLAGTPAYMAPEQFRGLRFADPRSDIYSLGVIAYRCLSGKLPRSAETLEEWVALHTYGAPPALLTEAAPDAAIPPLLATVVRRAIAREPEERYPTALEFRDALAAALEGRDLEPRRAGLRIATAGAAVLVIGAAGWAMLHVKPASPLVHEAPVAAATTATTIPLSTPAATATAAAVRVRPSPAPHGTPASIAFGSMSIDSEPWGEIFVDGVSTGRDTPAFDLAIAAGHHAIRVVNAPSHLAADFEVDIAAGQLLRRGTVPLIASKGHP